MYATVYKYNKCSFLPQISQILSVLGRKSVEIRLICGNILCWYYTEKRKNLYALYGLILFLNCN
jgi:hypothetical protein